jgi:hypothetical protein
MALVAREHTARTPFMRAAVRNGQWVMLGASSGALAGLLVGGVVGRLAMLLVRLTSPDAVIGRTSDDGFEIGRFSSDTLFLLAVTAVLGGIIGVAYVVAACTVPVRWRILVWTIVGATVGGSIILHADGIDFSLLEPRALSVALFIAIPAGGAALTAVLVERRRGWWMTNRRRTAIACVPAIVPMLIFFLPLIALAGLLLVSFAATSTRLTRVAIAVGPTLVRLALLAVATLGAWSLYDDVTTIL